MKTDSNKNSDYLFLLYIGILLVFGLVMLTSASSPIGYRQFGDKFFFIKKQLLFGVLPGIVAFLVFANLKYEYLKKMAWLVYIGMVGLLVLVFIPGVGTSLDTGAQSWIQFGGYSLQPAELAKLGLIIFVAYYISEIGEKITDLKQGFIPTLLFGIIPVTLVVLQPDIGTVSILFAILFGMMFVARARWAHMFSLAGAGIAGIIALALTAPYRAKRLTTFLHPELDPKGIGYHINQAFLAIGSGGILGLGLGNSRQKFQYLPEVHADSIFAIIAEEMGFVVAAAIVVLLILICFRGLKIAKKAPDKFSKLLVSGIIIWFMVQSFMNIGAMVGIMPITGVPLPFVSHGGTALVMAMAAVGIIANVSKYSKV